MSIVNFLSLSHCDSAAFLFSLSLWRALASSLVIQPYKGEGPPVLLHNEHFYGKVIPVCQRDCFQLTHTETLVS